MPALPTPDPLTTLANVKTMLGITGSAQDALIDLIIPEISAVITESLGRTFLLASNISNPITEYLSGRNTVRLILRHRPIQGPLLTGNTTAGSAVVSGLASTQFLFPNQCVSGQTLTPGSFVVSVGSGSVTLNQPAGQSATATPLVFGIGCWVDDNGYWGTAPGSFGPTTQLFEGGDFALRRDQPDGSSRSGILERINMVWDAQFRKSGQMLSYHLGDGQGNIKVQYVAGWATLPSDIELAAIKSVAKVRNSRLYGEALQSENYKEYGYALANLPEVKMGLISGEVGAILARYRNCGFGI